MDHCYARKNNISRGKAKLKKKRKIRNLRHLTLRLTGIDVEVILWIIKGYIPQFTNAKPKNTQMKSLAKK